MKIYITNISPLSIKDKHLKIDNVIKNIKYELISKEDGKYIIKKDKIYFVEPNMNQNYELIKNYKGNDLLLDKTKETYIKVNSQLPVNYICTKIIEYKYKGSKLDLIVECLDDLESNIIPINYYLEYKEEKLDLNDIFVNEELNKLLFKLK